MGTILSVSNNQNLLIQKSKKNKLQSFKGTNIQASPTISNYNIAAHSLQRYYNVKFTGLTTLKSLTVVENESFLKEILSKSKARGKTILKCTDFDGCESLFVPNPLKVLPSGGLNAYFENVNKFTDAGNYHLINTSRNVNDFYKMFGEKAEQLNIFGCKGNQFRGILDNTDKTQAFMDKFSDTKKYTVTYDTTYPSGRKVPDGKIFVKIEPVPIPEKGRQALIADHTKYLAPLGFNIEDKELMVAHHWRAIDESKAPIIDLNADTTNGQSIFNDIKVWLKANPQEKNPEDHMFKIERKEDSVDISKSQLIDYGIYKYRGFCNTHFNKQINKTKELRLHEDRGTKILELIDKKVDEHNKGSALQDMIEALGGKEKVCPWAQGDSVGLDKDDEPMMKVAAENGGIGCAVLCRDQNEIDGTDPQVVKDIENRLIKRTNATHLFGSCEQTTSFLQYYNDNMNIKS